MTVTRVGSDPRPGALPPPAGQDVTGATGEPAAGYLPGPVPVVVLADPLSCLRAVLGQEGIAGDHCLPAIQIPADLDFGRAVWLAVGAGAGLPLALTVNAQDPHRLRIPLWPCRIGERHVGPHRRAVVFFMHKFGREERRTGLQVPYDRRPRQVEVF